ncbi:MAG: hypothetical protein WD009_09310 [Phycisphaeraceae bacterium]
MQRLIVLALLFGSMLTTAGCGRDDAAHAQMRSIAEPHIAAASVEDAGRYLVTIAGCNDCHTPGWDRTNGDVPEDQWLLGSDVGFHGPWGTTYAGNVRLYFSYLTEDQWVEHARQWQALPPMPSMNINRMSEQDLRAIYRYVTSLEPVGEGMPGFIPPGEEPTTAYRDFHVQAPQQEQAQGRMDRASAKPTGDGAEAPPPSH